MIPEDGRFLHLARSSSGWECLICGARFSDDAAERHDEDEEERQMDLRSERAQDYNDDGRLY